MYTADPRVALINQYTVNLNTVLCTLYVQFLVTARQMLCATADCQPPAQPQPHRVVQRYLLRARVHCMRILTSST